MTKITLNLDLPDDLAARVAALPAGTVNRYAVAALQKAADTEGGLDDEENYAWSDDEQKVVYAGLAEAFADIDAGRVVPAEAVFSRLQERIEARRTQAK